MLMNILPLWMQQHPIKKKSCLTCKMTLIFIKVFLMKQSQKKKSIRKNTMNGMKILWPL